jgi:Transposase DDE domain
MATNFFPSRKRCCPECSTRTIKVNGQEVTEYYHRGVICHLVGHQLAIPLDLELLRPGEGEEPAALRLLERVFRNYPRFFDIVVGDALYFNAPFLNFCLDHHKHAIVVVKGDERLLLQDAQGLFAQRTPQQWLTKGRMVKAWDEEGFTSCEGVRVPLRVLHTEETVQRRERVAGQWRHKEEVSSWYWASTLSKNQFSTQQLWRGGHYRWDVENDAFNVLATRWGLDHCYKHAAGAIVNFSLTLFLAYVLLQCFWHRNFKPPQRKAISTLIGLADTLRRGLNVGQQAPWYPQLAQPP